MPENATTNESNHVTLILRELSDDEKMKYITEMREKALHDEATAMNAAEKRGMEKARAEGLAEGREEGRKARKAEIAEKMRKIGMTEEQIKDEISGVISLIDGVYKLFGFKYHIELSTRPEDSMGSDEAWEIATAGLQNALDENGIEYTINEGDGAFYGPKIDFHLEDSIGRTWYHSAGYADARTL